jgi:hypothetical protein
MDSPDGENGKINAPVADVAPDDLRRGCSGVLHRPIRAAGATHNRFCCKLCSPKAHCRAVR